MLTDSGGFQAFSLGDRTITGRKKPAMRKVTEEGVTFRSHHDGSRHLITPERSIQIQQALGADIIMAFDQPVYGLSSPRDAERAMHRTHRWLDRSIAQWESNRGDQLLFGIVQGGTHTELHKKSAAYVVSKDLPGNALGGLSVGENKAEMWEATRSICSLLPEDKPRYFMGLGDPLDLIEAVIRGCDMFDCVAPSRLARHGVIWQLTGSGTEAFWSGDTEALLTRAVRVERWNFHAAKFRNDTTPLQSHPGLPADLQDFSHATIAHYTRESEMLAYRILTLHNIGVLHRVCDHLRQAISMGKGTQLKDCFS
jgi:queuine tRNA-ribosyltransferase